MNKVKLRSMMEQFLAEDIGDYDVTTQAVFEEDTTGTLILLAKEEGIFSGEMVISTGFSMIDSNVSISLFVKDGDTITKGQQLAKVTGHVQALLTGERVVLNIIQRMSGIATLTKDAVTRLHSAHTRICDTRKTTPGFRLFEKYAVRCGGGFNHRMGLYDGIMIKDNHIDFCGSITKAVERVRKSVGHMVKIEVETESAEQVKEAVVAGVDIRTGDVYVGVKNSRVYKGNSTCVEDVVFRGLGGNTNANIIMTPAIRPRNNEIIPVCTRCQTKYPQNQFVKGTIFQ